jgi:DNA-directed RNA polymerase specialized sigma24 family protein
MDASASSLDSGCRPELCLMQSGCRRTVADEHADGDLPGCARRALAGLSPTQRQIVIEVAVRRRTIAAAAQALGVRPAVLKAQLTSALQAFRARLADAA